MKTNRLLSSDPGMLPPQAPEIEEAVMGALLLETTAFKTVLYLSYGFGWLSDLKILIIELVGDPEILSDQAKSKITFLILRLA